MSLVKAAWSTLIPLELVLTPSLNGIFRDQDGYLTIVVNDHCFDNWLNDDCKMQYWIDEQEVSKDVWISQYEWQQRLVKAKKYFWAVVNITPL